MLSLSSRAMRLKVASAASSCWRSRIRLCARRASLQKLGRSASRSRAASRALAWSGSKMPPKQRQRFFDLVDDRLSFGSHCFLDGAKGWNSGRAEQAARNPRCPTTWELVEAAGTRCQSMVIPGGRTRRRAGRRTERSIGRRAAESVGGNLTAKSFVLRHGAGRLLTRLERFQYGRLVAGPCRQSGLVVDTHQLDA